MDFSRKTFFFECFSCISLRYDQLTEPGNSMLQKGQVRDSNRITLISALKQTGFTAIDVGIAPDDLGKLQLTIETALDKGEKLF